MNTYIAENSECSRNTNSLVSFHNMNRTTSIVPRGFEISAHPVFLSYQIPEIRSVCIETREIVVEEVDETLVNKTEEKDSQHHCPICLRCFEDPVTMVACQHSFCVECINIWFQTRRACPICSAVSCGYVQCSDNSEETSSHSITRTWKLWSTNSSSTFSLDHESGMLAMKEHTLLLQNRQQTIATKEELESAPSEPTKPVEKKRKVETVSSPSSTKTRTAEKKKKKKRRKKSP